MYDEQFKKEYQAAVCAYTKKFKDAPSRMLLRGMPAEDALELMKDCVKDNEPLEKFYLDNHYLS
ncbi:hypothetical protein [Staphylococcus simulans]|uniref:hypothetical protein n=1 Tax=Staphylococcus simulans TaxID=1286 RepID=UPI000CD18987|nr:hypothetical protein [Staphylococcus simulans]PNZ42777.1 hypothetical protein CD112_09395 [Staphylococcus simulans]SQE75188.1 Uncharacterised protein [Staphylococcus simulans]